MSTDTLLNTAQRYPLITGAAGVLAVAALVSLALILRRLRKHEAASVVTVIATVLGLAWSAQGMWDTAVNRYGQDIIVASVLFAVFETMQVARMLKARRYRLDLARRAKHVRAVWLIACVMALVVALGEGWEQAPARLAIPLLVAYGWWTDLTADDDPNVRLKTSLRWTPRRLGLAIGMLEPEARDASQIDRDSLRDRMTKLAFRQEHGADLFNDLFRRDVRLARLKTLADDADLAVVRQRLARMKVDLMAEPAPKLADTLTLPPAKRIEVPGDRRTMGVHRNPDGMHLRGQDLKADGIMRMRASMTPERPRGMTAADLAGLYAPPLGARTAEGIAADARKQTNGFPLTSDGVISK